MARKQKKEDMSNIWPRTRADGSVAYMVRVADKDGKALYSKTFDDIDEARARRDDWKDRVAKQSLTGSRASSLPMSDIIDWYAATITPTKTEEGAKAERYTLALLRSYFGDKRIDTIETDDVDQFINDRLAGTPLKRDPVGATTVTRNLNTLSSIFSKAVEKRGVKLPDGNPCKGAERPSPDWNPQEPVRRPFSDDEIEQYRDMIRAHPYVTRGTGIHIDALSMFDAALYTGIRIGTLCSLTLDQIDWKNRFIHTRADQNKNGKTFDAPLTRLAIGVLKPIYDAASDKKGKVWPGVPSSNAAVAYFVGIKKRLGWAEDLVFHSTRHHFTSFAFDAFKNVLEARRATGHATDKAFEGYVAKDVQKTINKLDAEVDRKEAEREEARTGQ